MSKTAVWGIAATFLVMAIAVGVVVQRTWLNSTPEFAAVMQKVQTGVGEQKNVTLADGSKLHLNTNSVVTVDFSSTARNIVLLKGEAHFEVAHDTSRPFSVTAGNNTVTAVGTAFNMQYVDDNAFELVVTDGKVLVKDRFKASSSNESLFTKRPVAEEGLLMFAGEKATVQGKVEARESMSQNDIDDDLAWQQGMIVFKGEPLEAVLAEIGRYTPVRFNISDESLRKRRVAGYFKVGDIDGLLSALKSSFNINYEKVTETSIELKLAKS
jgi:transmembrane sensor